MEFKLSTADCLYSQEDKEKYEELGFSFKKSTRYR